MKKRRGYNPKRRIASLEEHSQEARENWRKHAKYTGNPEHKLHPGDYGLTPPTQPRPAKTLCDGGRPMAKEEAQSLLRQGLRKGIVSKQVVGDWPQNIWAVAHDGRVFEAQLENKEMGTYHGYPIPYDDTFREVVLKEWEVR